MPHNRSDGSTAPPGRGSAGDVTFLLLAWIIGCFPWSRVFLLVADCRAWVDALMPDNLHRAAQSVTRRRPRRRTVTRQKRLLSKSWRGHGSVSCVGTDLAEPKTIRASASGSTLIRELRC